MNLADIRSARLLFLLSLLLVGLTPSFVSAREAREDARIEYLLHSIESLEGATFIRNGSEHEAKASGAHLRMKLSKAGKRVKTAEDFIEGLASRSSFSGKPYSIRLADGTVTETNPFLREKLREFDQAHPQ